MTGTRHIWMASNASGGQIDADATIDDYECVRHLEAIERR